MISLAWCDDFSRVMISLVRWSQRQLPGTGAHASLPSTAPTLTTQDTLKDLALLCSFLFVLKVLKEIIADWVGHSTKDVDLVRLQHRVAGIVVYIPIVNCGWKKWEQSGSAGGGKSEKEVALQEEIGWSIHGTKKALQFLLPCCSNNLEMKFLHLFSALILTTCILHKQ